MTTIDNIKKWAKPHSFIGGKRTALENDEFVVSIVGGTKGLYGDFEKDFEVAIIDKKSQEFVTKFFYPEKNDDVLPYLDEKEVETLVNKLFNKTGFQVR